LTIGLFSSKYYFHADVRLTDGLSTLFGTSPKQTTLLNFTLKL